jgi:hypothetical protein
MHPQTNYLNTMERDRAALTGMSNAFFQQDYLRHMALGTVAMPEPRLARARRIAAEVRSRHSRMQVKRIISR